MHLEWWQLVLLITGIFIVLALPKFFAYRKREKELNERAKKFKKL